MPTVRYYVKDLDQDFPMHLSARKAAEIAGRNPQTIVRMLERGDIQGSKFSGVWKIDASELFAWLGLHGEARINV